MSEDPSLRASDADRERVAEQLRDHFAAGRLDDEELSSRGDAVYAARTTAELDRLLVDLPKLPVSPARQRAEMAEFRADLRRQLVQQTGGAMVPFFICVAIWAASGASGGFWPAFVLIFPLVFLIRNGWALYGPAPDLQRVEAELRRQHGGHHRRRGRPHDRHRHGGSRRAYGPRPPLGPGDGGPPR
jgi:DUF1707 SHOCT-like domain